jgi:hypothetical protein
MKCSKHLPSHTNGPQFVGYPAPCGAHPAPVVGIPTAVPETAKTVPPPVSAPPIPSSSDLLARLRGKIRPMRIPKLRAAE